MVDKLTAVDAAQRLDWVRLWWRATHPRPRVGQRLYVAYTATILLAMYGLLAYGAARSALPGVLDPRALARYAPPLLMAALVLAGRWGAYQGPVIFSLPDVSFLLGAPLSRRALARRRLVIAFGAGGAFGMLLAGAALVGLAGHGRGVAPDRAVGLIVGFANLGVLAVAASWAVERSARYEVALNRAAWPAVLVAAAAGAATSAGDAARRILLWSGPWGWAAQPGAGVDCLEWLSALVLLTFASAAATRAALRHGGDCPTERHARRAEGRAGATASLASFDARTARRALEAVAPRSPAVATRGLRRLRAAIVWRDTVAAVEAPTRTLQGAALAAGATVLGLTHPADPIALPLAMLLLYASSARLLATLRHELDVTARARVLLRPPLGRVLLAHTVVPGAIAGASASLAALGCAVAGALPRHGGAAVAIAVAAVAVVAGCAAMSARRGGRMPPELIAVGAVADPSGGGITVITWLIYWPGIAVALAAVPVLLVHEGGAERTVLAAGWLAAATAFLAWRLSREVPTPELETQKA